MLYHPLDLAEAIEAQELADLARRGDPGLLDRACARRMGGAGIRRGLRGGPGRRAFDPRQVPGLAFDLRTNLYVTSSGGAVSAHADLDVSGVTLSQAVEGNKPALVTTSFGGRDGIRFVRANLDRLFNNTSGPVDAATSWTAFATIDQISLPGAAFQYLYDQVGGRLAFFAQFSGTTMGWVDSGGSRTVAGSTPQTGEQIVTWVLDAGGTVGEIFRGSTSLGTQTYAATDLSGAASMGRQHTAAAHACDLVYRHFFLYGRVLTVAEQNQIRAWMSANSGVPA